MADTAQYLFQTIEKLLPLLEQFLYVLNAEKQALTDLDTDRLMQLTTEKSQLLDRLLPLSDTLQRSLPDNTALSDYLRPHLTNAAERDLFKRFIELSERAEKQHLENGATLIRLAQLNEGLLRILLGQQEAPTYDDKIRGRRGGRRGGNTLGTA